MPFTVELRPLALTHLSEAYVYYNSVKENLVEEFLEELQKFFDKIENNLFIFLYINHPLRHGKLHRFLYEVLYEVHKTPVIIYSIFMAKQSPDKKRTF
ncbi:MAG: type II toxin-antitoxin system RelE/ParE family toxin [Bacteroidota bacterium]|nr:type II toxin-antitoxin system RelE/ParE family toxin [Bacteroidota bacterium]